MVQVIPAILATTEGEYQKDISKVVASEVLKKDWVHIDFADNIFVQNRSIEPEVVSKFPTDFKKEAHLMVSYPKEWIDKLVEAQFDRIIFHIESEDNINEVIDYAKSKGMEVGLAIKIDTPIEKLEPFVFKINVILVMSIIPGFQGQPFIVESIDRIREIKSKNWPIKIGVDGAVKDMYAKDIIDAGADYLVVGSFLLTGNIEENLEKLWEAVNG